jgi:hypothetical protein
MCHCDIVTMCRYAVLSFVPSRLIQLCGILSLRHVNNYVTCATFVTCATCDACDVHIRSLPRQFRVVYAVQILAPTTLLAGAVAPFKVNAISLKSADCGALANSSTNEIGLSYFWCFVGVGWLATFGQGLRGSPTLPGEVSGSDVRAGSGW